MEATCNRMYIDPQVRAAPAPPGFCSVLRLEASLVAKFRVTALPDDFVPGYSVEDTLEKIRDEYTNYDDLMEEVQSACVERVLAGAKCPFSRHLALGTARHRCSFLGLLCSALTRLADDWAEGAFAAWRWEKVHQRSAYGRILRGTHPGQGAERTDRTTTHRAHSR